MNDECNSLPEKPSRTIAVPKKKSQTRVSPNEIAQIVHLRELSFGNRLIEKATGICRLRICYQLRKLGYNAKVFAPEMRGFRDYPPTTVAEVIELRKKGRSNREIGVETGMDAKAAYQILCRHGWRASTPPAQSRIRPLTTPEEALQMMGLKAQDFGYRVIAKRLGVTRGQVRGTLRRAGIRGPVREKQPLQVRDDVSYLNLNPATAWCLGLIYGDGSLSRNKIQVSLTSGDEDVLIKFAHHHGTPKIVKKGNAWTTTWTCTRLYRELEAYRLCPKKSAMLQFPRLDPKLMPHFVRGLIDSDGSFHRAGPGKDSHLLRFMYACICEPFMHDLREVLVQQAGLSPGRGVKGRYQTDTPNKVWKLKYSHTDAVKLGYWIHAESTPETRCDRKYAFWKMAKDHVLFARHAEVTSLPSHRAKPYRKPGSKQN